MTNGTLFYRNEILSELMLHMTMFTGNLIEGDIFSGDWGRFFRVTQDVFSGVVSSENGKFDPLRHGDFFS
jgi:hypothetical protein